MRAGDAAAMEGTAMPSVTNSGGLKGLPGRREIKVGGGCGEASRVKRRQKVADVFKIHSEEKAQ